MDKEDAAGDADALELEDAPDWINCLKGARFFTLNQALHLPAAMQIRN